MLATLCVHMHACMSVYKFVCMHDNVAHLSQYIRTHQVPMPIPMGLPESQIGLPKSYLGLPDSGPETCIGLPESAKISDRDPDSQVGLPSPR